jgi:hypothetical protein
MKYAIIEEAKKQILECFVGIAIPRQPSLAEGVYGPIRSEKVLKFNRKALRRSGKAKVEKVNCRFKGGDDLMKFPVGKPGSPERVEALISQYASLADGEISPFAEGGD